MLPKTFYQQFFDPRSDRSFNLWKTGNEGNSLSLRIIYLLFHRKPAKNRSLKCKRNVRIFIYVNQNKFEITYKRLK